MTDQINEEMKKYGIETITEERFKKKKEVKIYKIGTKEIAKFEFAILIYLFQNKNEFVERKQLINIRKQYYSNPDKARLVTQEISRIVGLLNKTFQETDLLFEIMTANGKVGLFETQDKS